ncbi:hypothetical protein [Terrihabitans rhizophilus]|uniref:Tail tape measure protein n=1 Tax=Terrihabitans rhizophilus TaxID=3092662 RepID=A0ABU4RNL9_9HYPH|nr:hypothetical protein [Terrihabitans sp. PJ23]MDX6806435.1 hypothetical protein [Terrihabitans sp. PJ23]
MAAENERLVVDVEARITQLEKGMVKASRVANDNWGKIEGRTKRAGAQMQRDTAQASAGVISNLRGIGAAFAGGFVGGAAFSALQQLPRVVRDVTSELANLKAEAARAGIDVEDFQAIGIAASESKVSLDALTDGLKEMNLRADEFVLTGAGSGAEAFQRIGYRADELKTKLRDPSALFLEIIGRLQQLDRAAQIRISDEIFGGTGGEQFVQMLQRGEVGIRSSMQAARDAGQVLDREMINKAAEIDRKFQDISRTIGTTMKGAIVDSITALSWFSSEVSKALQVAGDPFAAIEEGANRSTDAQIKRAAALKRLRDGLADGSKADGAFSRADLGKPTPLTFTPILPKTKEDGARAAKLKAIQREKEAVSELIDELSEELRLVDASEVQQRVAAELRNAGAAATDQQRQKITALINSIEAEKAQLADLEAAMEGMKGAAKDVLGGMVSDLRAGKTGAEMLLNAFNSIADRLIDIAISNLVENAFGTASKPGGLGGIVGGVGKLLGFSEGGYTGNVGTGKVAGVVHGREYVINADATARFRPMLEAINAGKAPSISLPAMQPVNSAPTQMISISAPVTVNATGGTAQQNGDLAKQVSREMENAMRAVVGRELRAQMRPGGILSR